MRRILAALLGFVFAFQSLALGFGAEETPIHRQVWLNIRGGVADRRGLNEWAPLHIYATYYDRERERLEFTCFTPAECLPPLLKFAREGAQGNIHTIIQDVERHLALAENAAQSQTSTPPAQTPSAQGAPSSQEQAQTGALSLGGGTPAEQTAPPVTAAPPVSPTPVVPTTPAPTSPSPQVAVTPSQTPFSPQTPASSIILGMPLSPAAIATPVAPLAAVQTSASVSLGPDASTPGADQFPAAFRPDAPNSVTAKIDFSRLRRATPQGVVGSDCLVIFARKRDDLDRTMRSYDGICRSGVVDKFSPKDVMILQQRDVNDYNAPRPQFLPDESAYLLFLQLVAQFVAPTRVSGPMVPSWTPPASNAVSPPSNAASQIGAPSASGMSGAQQSAQPTTPAVSETPSWGAPTPPIGTITTAPPTTPVTPGITVTESWVTQTPGPLQFRPTPPGPSVASRPTMPVLDAVPAFYHLADSVVFQGTAPLGSYVYMETRATLSRVNVSATGRWFFAVPVSFGDNSYTVWSFQNGRASPKLTYRLYRPTFWDQLVGRAGELIAGSPAAGSAFRVITGDPEDVTEFAASIGLDLIVFGDIRDVSKEFYFSATNDPRFDETIFALSAFGLLTTGESLDVAVSGIKNFLKRLAREAPDLLRHMSGITMAALKSRNLGDLKALGNLAFKLALRDLSALRQIIRSPGDILRLARYVATHGDEGLRLVEDAGKWVGVRVEEFQTLQLLQRHFDDHAVDTGLPWLGRAFRSYYEYLEVARSVITDPRARKILYYHDGNLRLPRLGYVLERQSKVFLVAVNETGQIVTFHNLVKGWGYVEDGRVFGKLLKIDPF